MRRFFTTMHTIDVLLLVYSNFCPKKIRLRTSNIVLFSQKFELANRITIIIMYPKSIIIDAFEHQIYNQYYCAVVYILFTYTV